MEEIESTASLVKKAIEKLKGLVTGRKIPTLLRKRFARCYAYLDAVSYD